MQSRSAKKERPAEEASQDLAALADALCGHGLADFLSATRQRYLDALPIPAAIVALLPEGQAIQCVNQPFRDIAEWDERGECRDLAGVKLLSSGMIGKRLSAFMAGDEPAEQFETTDGRSVAARHFTVRFARVESLMEGPTRVIVSMIDRTSQVDTERHLRSEMLLDSLTGLPNRLSFNEHVDAILADEARADGRYAVLALDLTRFSRVNESMGALAGDELLITFARRLVSALRPTDMLARTSGDEFAILLKLDRGVADALRAAERLKAVLSLPFRLTELEIRVDCAIGCALVSPQGGGAEEVLRNAQFALKRAKRTGTTQVYEPVEAQAVRRRFSMETNLRRAIESDELTLAFQPLIELATGRVASFEALARWKNDPHEPVSPNEFIPVAEESGLIVPLGRWALEEATQTMAAWDRQMGHPLPLRMSVNLSAIQISRDDIAVLVTDALAASGLPGNRLVLELTESAIIQDPDRAADVLVALKQLDVRVAMDDFGTGYTSLAMLQRLPIDVLKIDRSLIADLLHDNDSAAIVRAILSLADALGMETTAEGIEERALGNRLAAMGCTYAQGFHYARPMEADAAMAYWLERNA